MKQDNKKQQREFWRKQFFILLASLVTCCSVFAQVSQDTVKKEPSKAKEFALNLSQKLGLSGYTQVRYQYFFEDGKFNSFDIRRVRLDLKGNVMDDKIEYRLQVDFAGVPKIMDAHVSYAFNPYLKFTAGQFKVPFSLENITGDNKLLLINRSQVVEALVSRGKDLIGNNNGRDIGIQLSGAISNKDKVNVLEYYAGAFNGAGINTLDNNQAKDFSARVVIQPVKGLSFGVAYYNGEGNWAVKDTADHNVFADRNRDRFGAELSFVKPRYSAAAEFIRGEDDATTKQGYYIQLAGFPVKDKLQLAFKYDYYDSNTDKADNATSLFVFGLNYYLNKYALMQANYILAVEQGVKVDNDIIAIQLQLGF